MASVTIFSPITQPTFPPNTPPDIVRAYAYNVNCSCQAVDATCSNCLTVSPEFLMENRNGPAVKMIIALPIIAFIVVILRTYSRIFIIKRVGSDDFLAILSLVLYLPFPVLSIILIQLGSGRHLAYIQFVIAQDNDALNKTEIFDFIAHIFYTIALFVCRLSGIAFYLRLLDRSTSWAVLFCKIAVVLLILGFLPQMVLLIRHCSPITALWPYLWQPEADQYTCLAWGVVYSTNSGISLVCDLLLIAIAFTMILEWNIATRDKLLVAPILLPGAIVLGISSIRLYLVVKGQWEPDQSWWYDPMLVTENAEVAGTLVALCTPGLKPLFVRCYLKRSRNGIAGSLPRRNDNYRCPNLRTSSSHAIPMGRGGLGSIRRAGYMGISRDRHEMWGPHDRRAGFNGGIGCGAVLHAGSAVNTGDGILNVLAAHGRKDYVHSIKHAANTELPIAHGVVTSGNLGVKNVEPCGNIGIELDTIK